MLLVYLPVVLTVLYYIIYYYFTRTYNYWKKRNVVGPVPLPFFGNLKETTLRQKNMSTVFQEYYEMFPKEKIIGVYRMTTPCLLIRDLDVIKHIMIKDFAAFRDRGIEFSSTGLGQNLFHADGETWSALRAKFTPIFTSGKLKNMFHLLNERADIFLNHLHKSSQTNPEHDVHSLVQRYTISTIFACAFGIDFDAFEQKLDEALIAVDKMAITPTYAFELDMMYPGLLKKLNFSPFPAIIRNFFDQLVTNIILQRNSQPSSRGDFMDSILQLRQMKDTSGAKSKEGTDVEITDDMIAAQAFVFYLGGYETSATTLEFLLYHIALDQEIQNKLREEIDATMKAHNGEITYESLKDMKYLEKTFSETLRIYPIVDPLQRKANVDYQVPGTDVVIKKDQIVIVSARGIHHDENYYPNPYVFDPERFDTKLASARHPCAYMPFGVGPRNCIGMRFGTIQSRLCIAKLLSKFRVEASDKMQKPLNFDPMRIIISPKEHIVLNIVPRDS